jgi:outer membrane protein assembly factor BamD
MDEVMFSGTKNWVILLLPILLLLGCGGKSDKEIPDARTQFRIAMREYNSGHYLDAQEEFQRLIFNYPGESMADTAQYYLAMSYYKDKEYALAAGEFERLLSAFPASEFTEAGHYRLAMTHYERSPKYPLDQKSTYDAIEQFELYLDAFGEGEFADSSRIKLGELRNKLARKVYGSGIIYMKVGDYVAAIVYFDHLLQEFSDTDWAQSAQYQKGECYRKQKSWEQAKSAYMEAINGYSRSEHTQKAEKRLSELKQEHPEIFTTEG